MLLTHLSPPRGSAQGYTLGTGVRPRVGHCAQHILSELLSRFFKFKRNVYTLPIVKEMSDFPGPGSGCISLSVWSPLCPLVVSAGPAPRRTIYFKYFRKPEQDGPDFICIPTMHCAKKIISYFKILQSPFTFNHFSPK